MPSAILEHVNAASDAAIKNLALNTRRYAVAAAQGGERPIIGTRSMGLFLGDEISFTTTSDLPDWPRGSARHGYDFIKGD
jgi:hypothetical protein